MFILLIMLLNIQWIYFRHFIEKSIYLYLKQVMNQQHYLFARLSTLAAILSLLDKSWESRRVDTLRQRMSIDKCSQKGKIKKSKWEQNNWKV